MAEPTPPSPPSPVESWQAQLQQLRLAQIKEMTQGEAEALVMAMNENQSLQRLSLHFIKHGDEFGAPIVE